MIINFLLQNRTLNHLISVSYQKNIINKSKLIKKIIHFLGNPHRHLIV